MTRNDVPPNAAGTADSALQWLESQPGRYNFSTLAIVAELGDSAYRDLAWPPSDQQFDLRQAVYYRALALNDETDIQDEGTVVMGPNTLYLMENFATLNDLSGEERARFFSARDVRSIWLAGPVDEVEHLNSFTNIHGLMLWNGGSNFRIEDGKTGGGWTRDAQALNRILDTETAKKVIALELPAGAATTDEILDQVAKLGQLKALSVWMSDVTDAGMKKLQALENLQVLNLDGTAIGDAGIKHLAELPVLRSISLNGTQVTNASVESLARFPKLMEVRIWRTRINREGVARIKREAPGIKFIQHDDKDW